MKSLTAIDPLPEKLQHYYKVTIFGKEYEDIVEENGILFIKRGYIYKGVKYYETKTRVSRSVERQKN